MGNITATTSYELLANLIEEGDYVDYSSTLTAQTYEPNSAKTGTTNSAITTDLTLQWQVIGMNNEYMYITPTVPIHSVVIYGRTGYYYGAEELDNICSNLYGSNATSLSGVIGRSADYDDWQSTTIKLATYSDTTMTYWLATQYTAYYSDWGSQAEGLRRWNVDVPYWYLYRVASGTNYGTTPFAIRPIVQLPKSTVYGIYNNGVYELH